MTTTEHDVEMWRAVAKNLHDYIIRTRPPCTCVETEEYIQYRRDLANVPTPAERLLYAIYNEPDEDRQVETVCESCEALLQYERRAIDVWSNHPDHTTIPATSERN
jgi:hypothetical protein